jgi:broad specificity phosphatase PhoE
LFARPHELVFGNETAQQAHTRFAGAVAQVVERHPVGNIVIVTHGTVISLFVAVHANLDPFALWKQLAMPSFVVLAVPSFKLLDTVSSIADS